MGWEKPHVFSDVERALPAYVLDHMAPMAEIPGDIVKGSHKACRVAWRWFYGDLFSKEPLATIVGKKGITGEKIYYHIDTVTRSYEPKHEHKEAAVAYMISLWVRSIIKGDKVVYGEDLREALKELKKQNA